MSYKFRAQTGILVAGLLAATFAEACYYQKTTTVCFLSGATVDTFTWEDGATANVIATANWTQNTVTMTSNASHGYSNYIPLATGTWDLWCAGPAKITDRSGHVNPLNYWESGSAGRGSPSFPAPPSGESWGNQDTSSSTCT